MIIDDKNDVKSVRKYFADLFTNCIDISLTDELYLYIDRTSSTVKILYPTSFEYSIVFGSIDFNENTDNVFFDWLNDVSSCHVSNIDLINIRKSKVSDLGIIITNNNEFAIFNQNNEIICKFLVDDEKRSNRILETIDNEIFKKYELKREYSITETIESKVDVIDLYTPAGNRILEIPRISLMLIQKSKKSQTEYIVKYSDPMDDDIRAVMIKSCNYDLTMYQIFFAVS